VGRSIVDVSGFWVLRGVEVRIEIGFVGSVVWHRILGSSGRRFVQHCSFSNWVCEVVEGLPIGRRSRFKLERE
jgi:hypothetical protein